MNHIDEYDLQRVEETMLRYHAEAKNVIVQCTEGHWEMLPEGRMTETVPDQFGPALLSAVKAPLMRLFGAIAVNNDVSVYCCLDETATAAEWSVVITSPAEDARCGEGKTFADAFKAAIKQWETYKLVRSAHAALSEIIRTDGVVLDWQRTALVKLTTSLLLDSDPLPAVQSVVEHLEALLGLSREAA